jgi:uncharacterized RDD family membrane protein YckC
VDDVREGHGEAAASIAFADEGENTMMAAELYINRVLDELPPATPRRQQIALELRGHIAERLAAGQSMSDVLDQLGDPMALAESYLSAVPLVSAPHGRRILAKAIDIGTIFIAIVPLGLLRLFFQSDELMPFMPFIAFVVIVGVSCLCAVYPVVAEWRFGQTLGKYLVGLHVVRESGARISLGQSIVRQLPVFLQVFLIDALFVLFTDRRQRAFELLSKTRVVADVEST